MKGGCSTTTYIASQGYLLSLAMSLAGLARHTTREEERVVTILARFNGRTLAVSAEVPRLSCLDHLNQFNADRCDVAACAARCADKPCHTLKLCRNKTCRAGIGEWCREMVQAEVRARLESESVEAEVS